MGQLSQGIGPVREHGPRDCCLVCRSPLSEVSTVTWDAILVTVDGFGFGTLTAESCLKNVHCHTDHGSGVLGRDPRDSCRFWSPHAEKVCTVTQFRLGEGGGGGGDTIGGGGGRRTENRDIPGSYIQGSLDFFWNSRTLNECPRLNTRSCKPKSNINHKA